MKDELLKMEEYVVENLKGGEYLSGETYPMMIDFNAYPMLERIVLFENSPWHYAFEFLEVKTKSP